MAGPGKPLHRFGDERLDLELPGNRGRNDSGRTGGGWPDERRGGFAEVRQRGREPPGDEAGPQGLQPRQRQLRLHAPLRRQQFVPLVDHDRVERGEDFGRSLERQEDRERLGRRDERRRPVVAEPTAVGLARVTGADADREAGSERPQGFKRLLERGGRVGSERPQWRDPHDPQAVGRGGVR